MKLLNVGANAKTVKGDKLGEYLTGVLYLAPAKTSGYQTCPSSTEGCRASCLFTAGRGVMHSVEAARIRKTKELFEDPDVFIRDLKRDIHALVNQAKSKGMIPCVRLNGTSDIYWPSKVPQIFEEFSDVIMYNYTKEEKIMRKYMDGKCPPNYYLTFSRSESNWKFCKTVLDNDHTVAAVFQTVPETYDGYTVFSADETDLRFLDPKGQIGGLTAKGKAKKDQTGFVIRG
jgi:hypothetical protein